MGVFGHWQFWPSWVLRIGFVGLLFWWSWVDCDVLLAPMAYGEPYVRLEEYFIREQHS